MEIEKVSIMKSNSAREELSGILTGFSEKRIQEMLEHYKNPEKGGKPVKKSIELRFAEWCERHKDIRVKFGEDFHEWRGNHWHIVEEDKIKKLSLKFMGDEASTGKMASCSEMLKIDTKALKKTKNNSETIIPLRDSYIKITPSGTIQKIAADKELNFTYYINASFDGEAKCPLFTRYLQTTFTSQKTIDLLQEYIGYSLVQNINLQTMIMLIGDGGNGKSVLIDTAKALHFRHKAVDPANLEGFYLEGIEDATLCISDESDKRINEQNLKRLISGDAIQVNRKNKKMINVENQAKFLFSCNEFPHISDASDGFWRRMLVVPFNNKPTQANKIVDLGKKIAESELDGVLTWAVKGLQRLIKNRYRFTVSDEVIATVKKHKTDTNSALNFLSQFELIETAEPTTQTTTIFEDYNFFCKENNLRPFSSKKFWAVVGKEIEITGIDLQKKQKRAMICVGGVEKSMPRPHINVDFVYVSEVEEYKEANKIFGEK